jgi:hypothetical protein
MDMMRPNLIAMPPIEPDNLNAVYSGNGRNRIVTLTWNDNSITETSFVVQATEDNVNWFDLGTVDSPLDQPNIHEVRSFVASAFQKNYLAYRVLAVNTVGYGDGFIGIRYDDDYPPIGQYPKMSVQSISATLSAPDPESEDPAFQMFFPVITQ